MAELNGNTGNFNPGNVTNPPMDQLPGFVGSWQQALKNNLGQYCIIEFLIGTTGLVQKEGVLFDVGMSFVTLFDPRTENYIVCDFYSIKFVTFPASRNLPANRDGRRRV